MTDIASEPSADFVKESPAGIPAEHLLRVITLNIDHAPEAAELRTGLVCDELGYLRPQVLCLQEVRYNKDGSSTQLDSIANATGLSVVSGFPQFESRHGDLTGNAILSTLPKIESGSFLLGTPNASLKRANYAVLQSDSGHVLIVVSAHLAWGGNKERDRLIQATAIDEHVAKLMAKYEDKSPIAVLAGDLNTLPGSDTNRFLSGLGAGAHNGYTFWTDAFGAAGSPEEAITVAADNYWAQATARSVGIVFPEMLPDRRIDYVWTLGWVYGKPGSPVSVKRAFTDTTRYGYPASDHYGLTVDFWTPPTPGALVAAEVAHDAGAPTGQLAIITPDLEPVLV
ncbi:MAG TPA: endonuclease/exonuclease/phosphatase family protein [Arthrobacter sp.]